MAGGGEEVVQDMQRAVEVTPAAARRPRARGRATRFPLHPTHRDLLRTNASARSLEIKRDRGCAGEGPHLPHAKIQALLRRPSGSALAWAHTMSMSSRPLGMTRRSQRSAAAGPCAHVRPAWRRAPSQALSLHTGQLASCRCRLAPLDPAPPPGFLWCFSLRALIATCKSEIVAMRD